MCVVCAVGWLLLPLTLLQDPRRWNVAVTRAKRALFVVGNKDTLATDPCIAHWLAFCEERNLIVDASITNTWNN